MIKLLTLFLTLSLALTACGSTTADSTTTSTTTTDSAQTAPVVVSEPLAISYADEDPSSYADSFTQQTHVNDADLLPLIEFMRFLNEADDVEFEKQLPDYLDVDAFASYLVINAMLVNTDSMLGMNNNYYLY